jgi:ubiquitin C-terminal hydrolase
MGHYIAFSKRIDGNWYLFNDDQYFQVTEKEVRS